ncbi:hypothetical protein AYB33_14555 [Leptospira santarosai]|nr:hypothetical protein AYB33_14555 [Leptospira santarosai]
MTGGFLRFISVCNRATTNCDRASGTVFVCNGRRFVKLVSLYRKTYRDREKFRNVSQRSEFFSTRKSKLIF